MKTLPLWVWIAIAAVIAITFQEFRVQWLKNDLSLANSVHAEYVAQIASDKAKAEQEARAEEQRRQSIADTEVKNARNQQSIAETDAANARDDADRLRNQVNRLLASRGATCNAISAGRSKAEDSAARVLADLFSESVKRNQILAEEADRARGAGMTAERIYKGIRNE